MPAAAGIPQRLLCLAAAATLGERDGEMANRRLSKVIRAIHHEVNGIDGHRRIKAELAAMGHACGRHRVARLMREAGLRDRSRKRWRLVSSSRHALTIAPNHLDRQFASNRANRHWVSDITYVRTAQGWLYLAVVLDLYSRSRRRLGDAPPHAAGLGTRRAGDGHCTPTAERRSAAALGSRQPILRVRLPGLTSATSNRAQPFTSRELLGQRRDGELLPFAEG